MEETWGHVSVHRQLDKYQLWANCFMYLIPDSNAGPKVSPPSSVGHECLNHSVMIHTSKRDWHGAYDIAHGTRACTDSRINTSCKQISSCAAPQVQTHAPESLGDSSTHYCEENWKCTTCLHHAKTWLLQQFTISSANKMNSKLTKKGHENRCIAAHQWPKNLIIQLKCCKIS